MYLCRELLTETGSIFVQINEENVRYCRILLDEVFGSDNFCAQISFKKTSVQASALLPSTCDILLWFAKDRSRVRYRSLFRSKEIGIDEGTEYKYLFDPMKRTIRPMSRDEYEGRAEIPPSLKPCRYQ